MGRELIRFVVESFADNSDHTIESFICLLANRNLKSSVIFSESYSNIYSSLQTIWLRSNIHWGLDQGEGNLRSSLQALAHNHCATLPRIITKANILKISKFQPQLTPPPIGILSDACLSSSGSHYIEGLTPQPPAGLDDAHLQSNLAMSRMRKEESDEHEGIAFLICFTFKVILKVVVRSKTLIRKCRYSWFNQRTPCPEF